MCSHQVNNQMGSKEYPAKPLQAERALEDRRWRTDRNTEINKAVEFRGERGSVDVEFSEALTNKRLRKLSPNHRKHQQPSMKHQTTNYSSSSANDKALYEQQE